MFRHCAHQSSINFLSCTTLIELLLSRPYKKSFALPIIVHHVPSRMHPNGQICMKGSECGDRHGDLWYHCIRITVPMISLCSRKGNHPTLECVHCKELEWKEWKKKRKEMVLLTWGAGDESLITWRDVVRVLAPAFGFRLGRQIILSSLHWTANSD
jgi:hypothetical protein